MLYQREVHFTSFEEFNSFSHGWDTDFAITSADSDKVTLAQSVAPGLLLNTARLSTPTLQRGATPVGMRTFALPLQLPSTYCWRGLPVGSHTLLAFPGDRELFSTMGAEVEMLTLSVNQKLVDSCVAGWDINPDQVFGTPRASDLSGGDYAHLLQGLSLLSEFITKYGDHALFPQLAKGVQEYILESMLEPVFAGLVSQPVSQAVATRRVERATEYILAHLSEAITVADVCEYVGCSRRTLEQSFRKFADRSPKQFIQVLRFRHCRQTLLSCAPQESVSRIASQHGFWHMGQFATDYRKLFGESPGDTLARATAH